MENKIYSGYIIEKINDAARGMEGSNGWDPVHWEQIRAAWTELGIQIAAAKSPKADNADKYTTLEEVRIDNFDDAMKVLK